MVPFILTQKSDFASSRPTVPSETPPKVKEFKVESWRNFEIWEKMTLQLNMAAMFINIKLKLCITQMIKYVVWFLCHLISPTDNIMLKPPVHMLMCCFHM